MSSQVPQSRTIRTQLLICHAGGGLLRLRTPGPAKAFWQKRWASAARSCETFWRLWNGRALLPAATEWARIINRHVLCVQTRMDIELEFLDMIAQSGHKAAVEFVRVSDGEADEKIARQLQLSVGTPIIRISRLCTADGKPAIYCEDIVEKALAKGDYSIKDFKLPIFHFLRQFCGVVPYMDLTDVRPAAADPNLAEIFSIPIGTPLLNMDEVDFDIDGKPVFCSNEYFIDAFSI